MRSVFCFLPIFYWLSSSNFSKPLESLERLNEYFCTLHNADMRRSLPFIVVLMAVLWTSCGEKSDKQFDVEGKIEGMPKNELIVLEELGLDNESRIIDSSRSDAKGKFKLSGVKDPEQKLYRIRMGNRSIFILNDASEIELEGHWDKLEDEYIVKGSGGSASLRKLMVNFSNYNQKTVALHLSMEGLTIQASGNDSMLMAAKAELGQTNEHFLSFLKSYSDTTKFLPVAILSVLLTQNVDSGGLLQDKEAMTRLLASFDKRFGKQDLTTKFKELVDSNSSTHESQSGTTKLSLNQEAPNFVLKDINGKSISLAAYRGKYVLVDFWASWCPPCRKENPNIVAAFNTFKGTNFDILGVSLDTDPSAWKQAVVADSLTWTQVSDLGGWKSAVVGLYGIQSIPANFLVDPKGIVIGIGLKGSELQDRLQSILLAKQ